MSDAAAATAKVTVEPEVFSLISYDAGEIAEVARDVVARLGIPNPVHVTVDESTPLAKMWATLDGDPSSSDTPIRVTVESGALEDSRRFTNFSATRAALSLAQILVKATDRMRPDFADAPADDELTLRQRAAWDAYCAGRVARAGYRPNQQRFRYNYRNRFGFTDATDAEFDRLWAADDLGWHDLPAAAD